MRLHPFMVAGILGLALAGTARAADQTVKRYELEQLQKRVETLEQYLEELVPQLNDQSRRLIKDLNDSLPMVLQQTVVLDPLSKRFTRIETNAGTFMISVQKAEKEGSGVNLLLNLGNPNLGTYSDLKFDMAWGKKFDPSAANLTEKMWRASLQKSSFSFPGEVPSGGWTEVSLTLNPAPPGEWEHIECSLTIGRVQFQSEDSDGGAAPAGGR